MHSFLQRWFGTPGRLSRRLRDVEDCLEKIQCSLGRVESRLGRMCGDATMADREFRVFSQWGEDGLLDFLIRGTPGIPRSFIEFGVEDYRESNTRFLLQEESWRGLVIDGGAEWIASIRAAPFHARHPLTAVHAFVTRENINTLFRDNGFTGPIGLLSVDVDGMDYWLWDAVECVRPALVVSEFNGLFGAEARVTVPYRADFSRFRAHPSGLYAGASLAALHELGERKGYALVGINRAGNNAFFVQRDRLAGRPALTPVQAYSPPTFREARDPSGRTVFLSLRDSSRLIETLPVHDLATGRERPLSECLTDPERLETC